MLPTSTCTLGIPHERRSEVVEKVRQALTDQEWALVKISAADEQLSLSAPPRVMEKIQQALRLDGS